MSDTTQGLCTNRIVRFRSFLVYILYGFLWTEGANSLGRFWCAACNSVNRTCSTSTPCPKKTKQICFCQNCVKFPPISIIFGRKMGNDPNICEVHSLSTSPNLRYHLTVLNANVPNCYITQTTGCFRTSLLVSCMCITPVMAKPAHIGSLWGGCYASRPMSTCNVSCQREPECASHYLLLISPALRQFYPHKHEIHTKPVIKHMFIIVCKAFAPVAVTLTSLFWTWSEIVYIV